MVFNHAFLVVSSFLNIINQIKIYDILLEKNAVFHQNYSQSDNWSSTIKVDTITCVIMEGV
jgi:hypothetical protein